MLFFLDKYPMGVYDQNIPPMGYNWIEGGKVYERNVLLP